MFLKYSSWVFCKVTMKKDWTSILNSFRLVLLCNHDSANWSLFLSYNLYLLNSFPSLKAQHKYHLFQKVFLDSFSQL